MRDIPGYEGLYAVTSCGKVWSYRKKKFLKPCQVGRGYLQVSLSVNGVVKQFTVHRLVAEAYIPNPDNLSEINHKDENKTNNCINNLEWCNRRYNLIYGDRIEKAIKSRYGHGLKIYCPELDRVFDSQTAAAEELNLWKGSINKVCKGKQKTTGKYHFEFVES